MNLKKIKSLFDFLLWWWGGFAVVQPPGRCGAPSRHIGRRGLRLSNPRQVRGAVPAHCLRTNPVGMSHGHGKESLVSPAQFRPKDEAVCEPGRGSARALRETLPAAVKARRSPAIEGMAAAHPKD